jgi:hypothetical protein
LSKGGREWRKENDRGMMSDGTSFRFHLNEAASLQHKNTRHSLKSMATSETGGTMNIPFIQQPQFAHALTVPLRLRGYAVNPL